MSKEVAKSHCQCGCYLGLFIFHENERSFNPFYPLKFRLDFKEGQIIYLCPRCEMTHITSFIGRAKILPDNTDTLLEELGLS